MSTTIAIRIAAGLANIRAFLTKLPKSNALRRRERLRSIFREARGVTFLFLTLGSFFGPIGTASYLPLQDDRATGRQGEGAKKLGRRLTASTHLRVTVVSATRLPPGERYLLPGSERDRRDERPL